MATRNLRFVILLIYLMVSFNSTAQLSKAEEKIVNAVDKNQAEALVLLEKIININSGSMNFKGVKEVGDVLMAELDKIGLETRWVDGSPFHRSGHLMAVNRGKGPTLLLIGHLDTVFEPNSTFQKYKQLNDSTASGPGIADMKGGDVIIVKALKSLKDVGLLKDINVTVVMTGDEELSGRPLELARKDLIEAAKEADIAIGFENGDGDPKTAIVSRRGSIGWELKVTGIPAHSSQIFREDVGAGAIFEASRILNEFYEQLKEEKYLTFNPGMMVAGTDISHDKAMDSGTAFGKSNVVSKEVIVTGDLRAISPAQVEKVKGIMREIVKDNRPKTKAEIIFGEGYPPLAPTEGNYKLLGYFDQVSRDLGFGPVKAVDPMRAGAADVAFTAGHVDMVIDGAGLGGADDHTVNETGNLKTLEIQTKRAAVLIYRLSKGKYK